MPDVAEPVLAGDHGGGAAVGVGQRRRQFAHGARGAAAYVVGAQRAWPDRGIASCDRLGRSHGGGGNVADVDEVPPLRPVLEDPRRAAGRQGGTEERRHPGVRRVAGHPRAVHVVIAQRHRLPLGHPGPRCRRGAPARPWWRRRRCAARAAPPRAPAPVPAARRSVRSAARTCPRRGRRPAAAAAWRRARARRTSRRPRRRRPSTRRARACARPRGPSRPAGPRSPGRCTRRRAERRRSRRQARPSPRGGRPRPRRERRVDRRGVADVAVDELEAGITAERRDPAGVDARQQRVKHPDLMTCARERLDNVGSDKAGAAGHQYSHGPRLSAAAIRVSPVPGAITSL